MTLITGALSPSAFRGAAPQTSTSLKFIQAFFFSAAVNGKPILAPLNFFLLG